MNGEPDAAWDRMEAWFKELRAQGEEIIARLAEGDVTFENLRLRLRMIERFVYGGAGLAATMAILTAVKWWLRG